MSQEDISKMVERNPYKRWMRIFFRKTGVPEHKHFNQIYAMGYSAGAYSKLGEMMKLLWEKGMEKEEIRLMINKVLGKEVLEPSKT